MPAQIEAIATRTLFAPDTICGFLQIPRAPWLNYPFNSAFLNDPSNLCRFSIYGVFTDTAIVTAVATFAL